MDDLGKRRAGEYAAERAERQGFSVAGIATRAEMDPATVRDFLEGRRWPRVGTRTRLEDVLGLEVGSLARAARGELPDEDADDDVERAIKSSNLSRANQHRLIGAYYEMLEGQSERGWPG